MMKKILLLSASFGDGHRQVANALIQAFEDYPDVLVHSIDTFRSTNKHTALWNEKIYEFLTRVWPSLYGLSYNSTARLPLNHWLWGLLAIFSRKAAWKAIVEYQPDMVVQLFPDHALLNLPSGLKKRPQIGVVLTDYAVHSRWFHSGVNVYFLPHMASVKSASKWLDVGQIWQVAGIPLRKQFMNGNSKQAQSEQSPIVIATGGRGVFPDLHVMVHAIRKYYPMRIVIVLCGRNDVIFRRVQIMGMADPMIHAKGFVDNVASVLQDAFFAVIKAGGVTIAECMASECPMLFYKPLAGQERVNASICEQIGTGRIIQSKSQIDAVFLTLTDAQICAMRNSCTDAGNKDAASMIASRILEFIP